MLRGEWCALLKERNPTRAALLHLAQREGPLTKGACIAQPDRTPHQPRSDAGYFIIRRRPADQHQDVLLPVMPGNAGQTLGLALQFFLDVTLDIALTVYRRADHPDHHEERQPEDQGRRLWYEEH